MKKRKLLTAMLALWFGLPSFAEVYEGTCGENVRYSLDTETGVLALTGEGIISYSTIYNDPLWNAHKKRIKQIKADDGIKFPTYDWLSGCDSIVEPQYNKTTFIYMPRKYKADVWSSYNYGIPMGIKTVAPYAFSSCKGLMRVTMNGGCEEVGNNAFSNCQDLQVVSFPGTIKRIGNNAFYNCKNLESINMPDGVESVGANCFRYCNALTEGVYNEDCFFYLSEEVTGDFTIPGSPKKIAPNAFAYGKITTLKIPESVKEIGKMAFYYNTGLQRVEMPSRLDVLGDNAFSGCQALEEVVIPEGVHKISDYMFGGSSALKKVTLPETLDSIGHYAFQYCPALEEIQLPAGLKFIGSSAFLDCTALKKVNIPESLSIVDNPIFQGCTSLAEPLYNSTFFVYLPPVYEGEYTVPDGIKAVAGGAFASCNLLTAVNLPASVEKLGYLVFGQCTSLEHVNLPEGITSLLNYTFQDCSKLQSISLPSHLTHIGDGTFSNCASIREVEIPSTVDYIGGYAFSGCTQLARVVLPEEVDTLGVGIFKDCWSLQSEISVGKTFLKCPQTAGSCVIPEGTEYIGDYAFQGCEKLTDVQIPQSVKGVGSYAFVNCASLTEITLPEAVDTIGQHAFEMCWSLGRMTVPEGVRYLPPYTFANCAKMSSIGFPSSLVGIGENVFEGCNSLVSVDLPESVAEMGYNVFKGCGSLVSVTVPEKVKYLPSMAFQDCRSLKTVTLPEGMENIQNNAFQNCSALASIELPKALKAISNNVFDGCSSLVSIDIPDYVTSIQQEAFKGCTQLVEVNLSDGLQYLGYDAFEGCVSLTRLDFPAGLDEIASSVFEGCTNMAYVGVAIGNPNYSSYKGLLCNKEQTEIIYLPPAMEEMFLPETLEEMPSYYTWKTCTRLRALALPISGPSWSAVDEKGILGCIFDAGGYLGRFTEEDETGKMWSVDRHESRLPETLKKLTLYCDTLYMPQLVFTKVTGVSTKTEYATGGLDQLDTLIVLASTDIDTKVLKLFQNVKHIELSKVKVMEEGCMAGLKKLESLKLPYAGVGSITTARNFGALFSTVADEEMTRVTQKLEDGTSQTYYLPSGLQSLELAEGCETLPYGTFSGCHLLKTVTLPSTLYMVAEETFYGCAGLTDIYCKGASPASAFSNSFDGVRVATCKLHVPHGAGEMYKRSTGWKDFYYIEEEAPITVAVAKNIENAGVIYGMNEYQLGETAELKAVAHSGYVFSAWTEDGQVVSEEETYSFVVEGSRSLIAVFVPVSGSNSVETEAGSTSVAFTWEAEEGASCYQLNVYRDEAMTQLAGSLWFDAEGNPVKKRSTMLSATIDGLEASTGYYYRMTAYNEADQAISQYTGTFETKDANAISETLQDDVVSVRARSGGIVVEGAVGKVVMVFTLSGKMAVQKKAENQTEEITLERGFYIVKVGNGSYKTVVK